MQNEAEPIVEYVISRHARQEMERRHIEASRVHRVLAAPEQRWTLRAGRDIFQARVAFGQPPKFYLLRVIVDLDRVPSRVVTAYRTSKIWKYWRQES